MLNGKGKRTNIDGTTYEGDFRDNLYHGQGTYTFEDGTFYEGEFKNHHFNG